MNFNGIDEIVYGVEDMAACERFLTDWGLQHNSDGSIGGSFTTLDNSTVTIVPHDDAALPPAFEAESTLRRVVWGVTSETDLEAVRNAIAQLPSFAEEAAGPSCDDPNGMRLSFRVSRRTPVGIKGSAINVHGHNPRVDERSPVYDKANPVRIGHVVFFTADIRKTLAFYVDVLGFLVSDSYPDAGYFLRCASTGGHHDLFLLQGPGGKRGLNHVAFTARDIHEVFGGGIHMNDKGWKTQIGPGRHPISSAYFWYVNNPCGALAEYYANEDYCTAAWEPKEWERNAANFAEWAIAGGIDSTSRRQVEK
jgi:catechol 2,3-dioxygenase-like lactoylglutathione lyase family enzyme